MNSIGSKLTAGENQKPNEHHWLRLSGTTVQEHLKDTTNNFRRGNSWLTTLQKGSYTVDRSRGKRGWMKNRFHTIITFPVFSCSFFFCSLSCSTLKRHPPFQLHCPQPRTSCPNTWRSPKREMSYTQRSKEAQGQPGGAGLSGALIAGTASSLNRWGCLVLGGNTSTSRRVFILFSTTCITFKFYPPPQNPLPPLGVNSWADVPSCSLATQTCSGLTDLVNVDLARCPHLRSICLWENNVRKFFF